MSDVTRAVAPDPGDPVVRRLRAVLAAAAGWYRQRLLVDRPPAVVGLLRDRGLVDLAGDTPAGRRWQPGYAPARHTPPSGYGTRTAAGERGDGLVTHLGRSGFTAVEMVDAGLVVPGRGGDLLEVLRDRLVVPLVDGGGVVGFTARRLVDPTTDHDTGTTGTTDSPDASTGAGARRWAPPKWVNTATTVLYRKSEHLFGLEQQADLVAAARGRPVLVEGAVDAIAVNLAGHIGLAAGGTGLTSAHATALRQLVDTTGGPLLVAYDHDAAGTAATVRAADLLAGVDARVVQLPAGRDPADVLVAAGSRGLRRALAVTVPLVDAAVTARLDRWAVHVGNPVALVDAAREVASLVMAAPAGDRARLVNLVAARLELPADLVTRVVLDG